ncbi:MAG: hypothetical protein Rhirs2KO_05940 [Rhizobiaceae bacterium]
MRFLVDECVARPLVDALRSRFDDVTYVVDEAPGTGDADIVDWAVREGRAIVTEDYDFGELAFRAGFNAEAIIIVAPGVIGIAVEDDASRVADRLVKLKDELPGRLTIIETARTRQRDLRIRKE